MGSLKPNTPLIYESPDGGKTVYAREFGSSTRHLVGYQYDMNNNHVNSKSPGQKDLEDHILWNDIRESAKTNTTLQKAMERVILIYRLSKDDPK